MTALRFSFNVAARGHDMAIEVTATGCMSRINPQIEVELSESAQNRPAGVR